jgi:ferric-dicitrate binding protein FerR (iron transport regulator)
VLILAFAASWIMLPQREGSSLGAAEFVTGPSEMVTVKLSDGTVVRLAPESRLRLTTNAREVWLEGQAFFGVAAHAGKPFRVRTHAGTAEVLGTRFDARSREGSLRVVVVEGKVKLSAGDESLELIANEMGRISSGTPLEGQAVDEEALLNELDWLGKFIVFKATPLGDAARELSRHYGVPVAVLDSTLAQETIEGWFADRDLSEVIEILCRAVDAHCSILPSGVTIQP